MRAIIAAATGAAVLVGVGTGPSDLQRSDAFWRALEITGLDAERYENIGQLYRASDLVVVARIVDFRLGRQVVDRQAIEAGAPANEATVSFGDALIEVETTLSSSSARAGTLMTVQFLLPDVARLDRARSTLPNERAVFFLRDMWEKAKAAGYSNIVLEDLEGVFDLVVSASVIRDIDGVATSIAGAPPYVSALDGISFTTISFDD